MKEPPIEPFEITVEDACSANATLAPGMAGRQRRIVTKMASVEQHPWQGRVESKETVQEKPVHVLKKETARRYVRPEGITSYLLASPWTSTAEYLTTTLAVIQPGGEQRIHRHPPEQVYFILEGRGLMTVGDETQRVGPGDCIFIPSGQPHGLKNDGEGTLRYFSAAAPAYQPGHLEKTWPLQSEAEIQG